jgi:hypothetical protein
MMRISLASKKGPQVVNYYQELLQRIRRTPGMETAGAISHLPLSGAMAFFGFSIEGKPAAPGEDRSTHFRAISAEWLPAQMLSQRCRSPEPILWERGS